MIRRIIVVDRGVFHGESATSIDINASAIVSTSVRYNLSSCHVENTGAIHINASTIAGVVRVIGAILNFSYGAACHIDCTFCANTTTTIIISNRSAIVVM